MNAQLEGVLARAAERPGERPTAVLRRWHDDTHPYPWEGCPERPCAELQYHSGTAEDEGVLRDVEHLLSSAQRRGDQREDLIEGLAEIVSWWRE